MSNEHSMSKFHSFTANLLTRAHSEARQRLGQGIHVHNL
jgi:hypothetical protein